MKVLDFTTTNYPCLSPDSTIQDALQSFLNSNSDISCVTQKGRLLGIVHKNSVYRYLLAQNSMNCSIKPIIKHHVITVHKDYSLYEARDIMIRANVSHAVVLDEFGDIFGIMSKSNLVLANMTELENVANRLTSLIENLQDAVISVDKELKITAFNETAIQLLRLDKKNLVRADVDQMLPTFKGGLEHILKTGQIMEGKRIFIENINLTVITQFIPIKELGIITGAMMVLRDVTSYESIASELESTKKLQRILDSAIELSYDGVIVTDSNGNITMANQGILNLLDLSHLDAVIGQPLSMVVPEITSNHQLKWKENVEGELIKIKNKKCIISQRNILHNDKKLGVIIKILFQQLDLWKNLFSRMEQLEYEVTYYRDELIRISSKNDPFPHIITNNEEMKLFKKEAAIAAISHSTILITGESGTGKEIFAQGIHQLSGRKGEFIKVNCAAIPEDLLESEFFGYSEGAFTGAKKGGKPGKFELADNGTLFLDEIGDMPLSLQVKLLRVLQEREFERIGDTKTTKVDVRIICATNQDLEKLIREGKFREDLYYRIYVIHLSIPSLQQRFDDIPILTDHFIKKFNKIANKKIIGASTEVLDFLMSYHWPGNIRQLENVIERSIHYCDSGWIEMKNLPPEIHQSNVKLSAIQPPFKIHETRIKEDINRKKQIADTEKQLIIKALKETDGNRTQAADILGISRSTLYQKLKKYKIKESLYFSI